MSPTKHASAILRSLSLARPLIAGGVVILMLAAGSVTAALAEEATPPPRARGLSFAVASDFQLRSYDGALLSWRTRSDDGRGWRYGAWLTGKLSSDKEYLDSPDTSFTRNRNDDRNLGVNLVVLRVWGARRGGSFAPYWGLGPTAAYQYARQARGYSYAYRVDRVHDWSAGVAGVLGAEWRATESLSLLAEYGLTAKYSWRKEDTREDDGNAVERRTKSVRVESREVRLGLTVWFN